MEDPQVQSPLEEQTRFQVDKVDGTNVDVEAGGDEADSPEHSLSQFTYTYDTRYAKSLGQLTNEALPRDENYRDFLSNHNYRPTLDELHEGQFREKIKVEKEEVVASKGRKGKVIKFGWLEGVFVSMTMDLGQMRCLLNIWGVMLFLRLSWVVGQAGIVEGLLIITLANVVTLVTAISMSAVSTNGQISAGGIYYMISRSLGPEFGGAIGLMFTLANSIAVSMYIVGFCESLQDLVASFGGAVMIDGGLNDIRVVGIITLIGILVLAIIGMDWVTRFQMGLMFVLLFSQVDFIIGSFWGPLDDEERAKGFIGYDSKTFWTNMDADYRNYEGVDHDFFSVFAVFFPAVTGIVAGANLSGDLKDPGSAIPLGTLLAIAVTFVSYFGYAVMLGGCVLRDASGNVTEYMMGYNESVENAYNYVTNCTGRECVYGLEVDSQAMELVSIWGPLIYGGCFAATLSSAIASLVGAPRVLQALAKDKLYPFIGYFGEGYGANNDPVRGYVLVFIISFGCILIAQLNAIAPLLSNFFLAAYALINFSVFHATISKTPGWRPSFKYYNAWVSLLGTILCVIVMFLMSWWTALITFIVTITLYLYVQYRKPEANWGSSTQAQSYNTALKSMQELNTVEDHVKNYRPQILLLTGMPGSRPPLVDFANLITKKGHHSQRVHETLRNRAMTWLERHRTRSFFCLVEDPNFEVACQSLIQLAGLGRLRPNLLLMGYKGDWSTCHREELRQYFNVLHNGLDRHLALGILRIQEGLDYSNVVQEEEEVTEKKRNKSGGQLSQDGGSSSDGSTPPGSPRGTRANNIEASEPLTKKGKKKKGSSFSYTGPGGQPLSKDVINSLTRFTRKQRKGTIDVWWLYDDGGLTLLLPYILSTRKAFEGCKLRVFALANKKNEFEQDARNMAALLSKFRIDYSDIIVIPDITKKAQEATKREFEALIKPFKATDSDAADDDTVIRNNELIANKEKSNRHMRLRELLQKHSREATFVVMTMPMPRKGVVSAPLYMAWLELLTRGMPPFLLVRGNQTSVLTYYS
ncbi:hypothetical protein B566_EDAN012319 [Ephemera danica]|nr:hypothetical protein B566_EDAN012319 [Ephemera danica]